MGWGDGSILILFKRKSDEDQTQQETQQELIKVGLEHCNLCVQAGGEGCT